MIKTWRMCMRALSVHGHGVCVCVSVCASRTKSTVEHNERQSSCPAAAPHFLATLLQWICYPYTFTPRTKSTAHAVLCFYPISGVNLLCQSRVLSCQLRTIEMVIVTDIVIGCRKIGGFLH